MNSSDLIKNIAKKDFDLHHFVQMAIADEKARDLIVNRMISDADIMVYYHCYYVISKASLKKPELFYPNWDQIAELLHHKNSYHRSFALDIIGNLTLVDRENRFAEVEKNYFSLINDKRFMTGNACLQNFRKIYRHKPRLRAKIVALMFEVDERCDYSEKQKALLKYDVLDIFEEIYERVNEKVRMDEFIKDQVNSISPKTRNKAKQLVQKFKLK
jgi:hypothetical protein